MKKRFALFILCLLSAVCLCSVGVSAVEERTVYVSDNGSDNARGTVSTPFKTLYAAIRALPYGGKIVVCGPLSLTSTEFPSSEGLITITSVGDEDYRASNGGDAVMKIGGAISLNSAVSFENIDITVTEINTLFVCNGNYAKFGYGIATSAEEDFSLPGITASCAGLRTCGSAFVEIDSGDWHRVRGGVRGTASAEYESDINIIIRGGSFAEVIDIGGDAPTKGNGRLYIYGGSFAQSIYGASETDFDGNIYISVYGGFFGGGISASRDGRISGSFTVNALSSVYSGITSSELVGGTANVYRLDGVSAPTSGITSTRIYSSDTIIATDNAAIETLEQQFIPSNTDPFAVRNTASVGNTATFQPADDGAMYGNLDGVGKLSLRDMLAAMKTLVSGKYDKRIDVDGNRDVSLIDVLRIMRAILRDETRVIPEANTNILTNMLLFGNATVTDGKISGGYAFGNTGCNSYTVYSQVSLGENAKADLYFACDISDGITEMNGYCFEIDAAKERATLYRFVDGEERTVADKVIPIDGTSATLRAVFSNGNADIYFETDGSDNSPYALFNLSLEACGQSVGVYAENAIVSLPVAKAYTQASANTYTNTLITQFTDPEIFYENGKYYIFGTQTATQATGVKCFSTTDFSEMYDEGFALTIGDAFGDNVFKAANIVKYGDYYYIFYMAKSNTLGTSVTAYASSDKVTGPYTNSAKTSLTSDLDFIGGQPFVDDDGQVYLIYTRTTGGNKVYGAKITLNNGTAEIDLTSEQQLIVPTEDWECQKASVTECGFIVKHNGIYYLLYSGGNYNSSYGTGYATSENPLGPYTKYAYNPILSSNDRAFGVGAASVFASPDGSEHFITYLRNFSPTVTRPLCTCIDRIRFVEDPSGGVDRLQIGGPTVTPQPLPSKMGSLLADWQAVRFIW